MSKLKSFEQFVADIDRAEEIEQTQIEIGAEDNMGTEEADAVAKTVQHDGLEESDAAGLPAEELEDETKLISDEAPEPKDVESELELKGEGDAAGEEIKEELEISEEETEKTDKTVAEMLQEAYKSCKNEAKVWEADAHDDHTVESYMKENAALIATLAANTLKEMKDDYSVEAYEAACNEMIEAYTKKMNEMKESYETADAEDID